MSGLDDTVGSPYFSLSDLEAEVDLVAFLQSSGAKSPYAVRIALLKRNLVRMADKAGRPFVSCCHERGTFTIHVSLTCRPSQELELGDECRIKKVHSVSFPIDTVRLADSDYRYELARATGTGIIDACLSFGALTDMFLNTLTSPVHGERKKQDVAAFEEGDGVIDFRALSGEELTTIRALLERYR